MYTSTTSRTSPLNTQPAYTLRHVWSVWNLNFIIIIIHQIIVNRASCFATLHAYFCLTIIVLWQRIAIDIDVHAGRVIPNLVEFGSLIYSLLRSPLPLNCVCLFRFRLLYSTDHGGQYLKTRVWWPCRSERIKKRANTTTVSTGNSLTTDHIADKSWCSCGGYDDGRLMLYVVIVKWWGVMFGIIMTV